MPCSLGLTSCWGDRPAIATHGTTTYNARTFMQAQLNKAVRKADRATEGDRNLKDFLIFSPAQFTTAGVTKDNLANRTYDEEIVFPTLAFPSDHAVIACELVPTAAAAL